MTPTIIVHFPYKLFYYSYIHLLLLLHKSVIITPTRNTVLLLKCFLQCLKPTLLVEIHTMLELKIVSKCSKY